LNTDLVLRVIHFISEKKLIFPGENLILAVSGGADSMAMLYCFAEMRDKLNLKLNVFHVNHNVRIPDAGLDEQLVRDACLSLKIPFDSHHLQGYNLKSTEDELRKARYSAFAAAMASNPDARLATAHHLDDQIETLLMRLSKGASIRGLRGIPVQRGKIVRPFLFLKRDEILEFVRDSNIPFREDYTNTETDKLRNAVRQRIMPEMEAVFGVSVYSGISRTLSELNAFHDAIQDWVKDWVKTYTFRDKDKLSINLNQYNRLSSGQQKMVLSYCVSAIYPLNSTLPGQMIERFADFSRKAQTGSRFAIRKDLRAEKEREFIRLQPPEISSNETRELFAGSAVCFGRNKIEIAEVFSGEVNFNPDPGEELICGDQLKFPLQIRSWQSSDYFFPLGMKNRQKLSDFFVDHKVERTEKFQIPLLVNQSEIVWVVGLRLDNRYRVTPKCQKIFRVTNTIIQE